MPNLLDASGLQTKDANELNADLTAAYQSIYGTDINVDSNSPDGQRINIHAQEILDVLDLIRNVHASFDPDQAIGTTLDSRVAINGVKRKGGTFTLVDVTVTTDRPVALVGLDSDVDNPTPDLSRNVFTVADNAGNQFYLRNSFAIGSAGATTLNFRAANAGALGVTSGAISTPVTVAVGVISVLNGAAALSIGIPQEKDADLKVRRRRSVALSSRGYYDSLRAALLNINGVTTAEVYENTTGATDADGIPSHSIWVIVNGGSAADIGAAIYAKRNGGTGMKGAQSVTVTRSNGSPFVVYYDLVTTENLYLKFQADTITPDITTTGVVPGAGGATPAVLTGLASTAGMAPGFLVRGVGIPAGATILTVDSGSQITLSAPTTGAGGAGVAITVVQVVVSVLKDAIVAALVPEVFETLDVNGIATLIQTINPNILITNAGLSLDNITFYPVLAPSQKNHQFSLIAGQITIV